MGSTGVSVARWTKFLKSLSFIARVHVEGSREKDDSIRETRHICGVYFWLVYLNSFLSLVGTYASIDVNHGRLVIELKLCTVFNFLIFWILNIFFIFSIYIFIFVTSVPGWVYALIWFPPSLHVFLDWLLLSCFYRTFRTLIRNNYVSHDKKQTQNNNITTYSNMHRHQPVAVFPDHVKSSAFH